MKGEVMSRSWISALLWPVVLGLVLTGCKTPIDLAVKGGGVGFLFQVEQPKAGGIQAMVSAVQRRLEAWGVAGPQVTAAGDNRIKVLVGGVGDPEADRMQALLTRPAHVSFCSVDDGTEFFEKLKNQLPGDGSVRVAVETYQHKDGQALEIGYLMANHKKKLQEFLATVKPPAGRKLTILPGEWGVAAYLIEDPPGLDKPLVEEAKVVTEDSSGEATVYIRFAKSHWQAFAELTKKNLNRRLAILVNGEIRSLPFVQTPIDSGQAKIGPSPVTPIGVAEREAKALAAGIKAWGLSAGLSLVERQLTPAVK
jgi:SecD/SecF fusion protein